MVDLKSEAKRLANEHPYDRVPRRKSKLDRNKRKYMHISKESYLFIMTYARQHNLFLQEAADELLKIGIKNVYYKEPKDILSPGKIMQFIQRKGPGKSKDNKPQK